MRTKKRVSPNPTPEPKTAQLPNKTDKQREKLQTEPAAIPALINPALAAANMVEAMAAFRVRTNEAGSLVLLLSASIRLGVKENAEFDEFDGHKDFVQGVHGLALGTLNRLLVQADVFGNAHAGMIRALGEAVAPVPPMPLDESVDPLLLRYGYNPEVAESFAFEKSKNAMTDLLELAGGVVNEKTSGQSGFFIAAAMRNDLDGAFDKLWHAAHALREAAIAVEWQRAGGHQAAA